MDISVVIPLLNERESLPELVAKLHEVKCNHGLEPFDLFKCR